MRNVWLSLAALTMLLLGVPSASALVSFGDLGLEAPADVNDALSASAATLEQAALSLPPRPQVPLLPDEVRVPDPTQSVPPLPGFPRDTSFEVNCDLADPNHQDIPGLNGAIERTEPAGPVTSVQDLTIPGIDFGAQGFSTSPVPLVQDGQVLVPETIVHVKVCFD